MPRNRKRCKYVDHAAEEEGGEGKESCSDEDDDSGDSSDKAFINDEVDGDTNDVNGDIKVHNGPFFDWRKEDQDFANFLEGLNNGRRIQPSKKYTDSVRARGGGAKGGGAAATDRAVEVSRQPVKSLNRHGDTPSLSDFVKGVGMGVSAVKQEEPPKPVKIASLFLGGVKPTVEFTGKKGLSVKKVKLTEEERKREPGVYKRKDGSMYIVDEDDNVRDAPDV